MQITHWLIENVNEQIKKGKRNQSLGLKGCELQVEIARDRWLAPSFIHMFSSDNGTGFFDSVIAGLIEFIIKELCM